MYKVVVMNVGRIVEVVEEVGVFDNLKESVECVRGLVMSRVDEEMVEELLELCVERECDFIDSGEEVWDVGVDEFSFSIRKNKL